MKPLVLILFFFIISFYNSEAQIVSNPSDKSELYFPLPDSLGGWRTLTAPNEIKSVTEIDKAELDKAFDFVRSTTKNGGLLVVRHGYLVYEKYFGKGQRDATPNSGSCGKPFTSIAVGIMMDERRELFPDGLDQKIFTRDYLPSKAFPLNDPRMADIKLGQLLSFTAGIRGNNPVYINGESSEIDPVGPDGWYGMTDEYALGLEEGTMSENTPFSAKSLWCDPMGGYSYATASIHIASIMLRHIAGMELEDYLRQHLAKPLGWGQWTYGYKYASRVNHTPGGGGIALRSTDMLRFCYMLLHKGQWNNQQIIPKEYVRQASKASIYNPHFNYSLQFNVNTNEKISEIPSDTFWKVGSGGHCFFIVPSLDLIVWKMGGRDGQYSISDTGLPELKLLPDADHPITNAPEFQGNVYVKTLEMVISSIIEADRK